MLGQLLRYIFYITVYIPKCLKYQCIKLLLKILSCTCRWCPIPVFWPPSARSVIYFRVNYVHVVIAEIEYFLFFLQFDGFSRELCIKSLLEIMDMFSHRLWYSSFQSTHQLSQRCSLFLLFFSFMVPICSCHGKAEECIGLCRAMLCSVVWLLQGCAWYCERLRDPCPPPAVENSLRACLERMANLLNSTKNRALVHIARLEEQGACLLRSMWNSYVVESRINTCIALGVGNILKT